MPIQIGIGIGIPLAQNPGGSGDPLARFARMQSFGGSESKSGSGSAANVARVQSFGGSESRSGSGSVASVGLLQSFGGSVSSTLATSSSASTLGSIYGSKLSVWYDFADTATLWSNAAKTVLTANGGTIWTVADKSGNNRDGVTKGGAFGMAVRTDNAQSGKTSATFTASAFNVYDIPNPTYLSSYFGAIVVCRGNNNTAQMAPFGQNVTSVSGMSMILNRTGVGSNSVQVYTSGGQSFSTLNASSVATASAHYYLASQDISLATNEAGLLVDGAAPSITRPANGNNTTVNRNGIFVLGYEPNFAAYFDGVICEFGVLNAAPSAGELSSTLSAMQSKWGTP